MGFYQQLIILLVSLTVTIVFMPFVIRYFKVKQLGQITRDEGPKWHQVKSGTPTMGGVAIILAATLAIFILSIIFNLFTPEVLLLLFIFGMYGLIGFLDDYIKVVKKRNLGLTSRQKFISQIIGGIIFYIGITYLDLPTTLTIPFVGDVEFGVLYAFFVVFWMVGFSNATNLTDGIDGLLATNGIISFLAYGIIAYFQNQMDLVLFSLAIVGSLVGFFIFNKKPARIFMGDVGSLALGAILAGMSILLKAEWSLLLIGLVYVLETASVMLQVTSFKLTGKRIFKMSPVHHHFEMIGYGEWKIVGLFSLISLVSSLVAVMVLI